MSYKRRYRKYYRRPYRRYYKKRPSGQSAIGRALDIGKKALSTALMVQNLVNVELKDHDVTVAGSYGTPGSVQSLCLVPQGDQRNNRNGDTIRIKSIRIKGHCNAHLNALAAETQHIRILIFIDRENNNPGGTSDPDLSGGTYSVLESSGFVSFPKLDNKKRYRIIYDKTYTVHKSEHEDRVFGWYKKLNMKEEFVSSVTATPKKNALWAGIVTTDNTYKPGVTMNVRIKYIDN